MTLALLYLVTSTGEFGARAWKGFDWDTMNRLHEKGYISNPKSKAKDGVPKSTLALMVSKELKRRRSENLPSPLFAKA